MKPTGIILTYMRWFSKWFLFNLGLFIWQIVFLVVGKIYGKVQVRWRDIWRAAQVCHVRLCLKRTGLKSSEEWAKIHEKNVFVLDPDGWDRSNFGQSWSELITESEFRRRCSSSTTCGMNESFFYTDFQQSPTYEYISFTHPEAKLDYWHMDMIDGKRFRYYDPTFDPSPEFIEAMVQYAYDQVGKPYDVPQLASYALNLAIWIVRPSLWGKEVIKWFNKPGGHESCSSGVTADLRWAEDKSVPLNVPIDNIFFKGYHTAVASPCLYYLTENWKEESDILKQKRWFDRLVGETTGVPDFLRGGKDET